MKNSPDLHKLVLASLMAALIAVGGYLAIPIGPVPIVLQNLFVLVAALLLGSKWGSAAVAVYLLAGACGLPVFAGGGGGLGHLFGPRGGYLFGFLVLGRQFVHALFILWTRYRVKCYPEINRTRPLTRRQPAPA